MSDIQTAETADAVITLLKGYRFNFSSEDELQRGVWEILSSQPDSAWLREHRLSKDDRIDFFHPPTGVGIEAKIDHPLSKLTRQVHGYVQHEEIAGLIIVTSKTRLTRVPDRINGKPIRVLNLIGSIL